MAITDEIKEQQKKLSDMEPKEKLSYIIYYYKYHFIIGAIVLALVSSFIITLVTDKEDALYAVAVNTKTYAEAGDAFLQSYADAAGIDLKKQDVVIETGMHIDYSSEDQLTYNYVAKIMAMLNSKTLDCMIADDTVIDNFSELGAFADLSTILPQDLLDSLKNQGYKFFYAKDESGKEIPAGIYMKNSSALKDADLYEDTADAILSVAAAAPEPDNAIAFVRFLTQ